MTVHVMTRQSFNAEDASSNFKLGGWLSIYVDLFKNFINYLGLLFSITDSCSPMLCKYVQYAHVLYMQKAILDW